MMHDTELLQYLCKTADMGDHGIQSVLGYAQDASLKAVLQGQQKEYQKLRGEAQALLEARNEGPGGVGQVAKASAGLMSAGKMLVNHTDSKIAEMAILGNQKGINKTIQHLHDYSGQDDAICALTKQLLATEQANAEQLKRFL